MDDVIMDKFAKMVHYFIKKGQNVPTFGRTVLYKLCYFSDFDFYELNERSISGMKYRRLPQGPTPLFIDVTTDSLINSSIEDPVPGDSFSEDEIAMMDLVFDRHGKKTAKELSEFSHRDVPWIIADDGGEISYEAVFYREAATSVMDDDEQLR